MKYVIVFAIAMLVAAWIASAAFISAALISNDSRTMLAKFLSSDEGEDEDDMTEGEAEVLRQWSGM